MKMSSYEVVLAPKVLEAFEAIPDPRVREDVAKRVDGLKKNPVDQGRALTGELSGFYVVRNSEAGYRIIYRVEGERVVIYAFTLDPGRTMRTMTEPDLHSLARRMVAMKMFDLELLDATPKPEPEVVRQWKEAVESTVEYWLQEESEPESEHDSELLSAGDSTREKRTRSSRRKSARRKKRKKRGGKSDEHDRE